MATNSFYNYDILRVIVYYFLEFTVAKIPLLNFIIYYHFLEKIGPYCAYNEMVNQPYIKLY